MLEFENPEEYGDLYDALDDFDLFEPEVDELDAGLRFLKKKGKKRKKVKVYVSYGGSYRSGYYNNGDSCDDEDGCEVPPGVLIAILAIVGLIICCCIVWICMK